MKTARPGAAGRGRRAAAMVLGLAATLGVACTPTRIVPVPAPGVEIDAARATASALGAGVGLVVQAEAWRGSPWDLEDHVTPFLVTLTNGTPSPVEFDYPSFRLFDDTRFQYTALPPAEVERVLRWRVGEPVRLAAVSSPPPVLRRRSGMPPCDPCWGPWWRAGYEWYGWPWYGRPPIGDVYQRALAMEPLQPGARLEGFVYFPRLRATAKAFRLEFHHRVGDAPHVLTLSFAVDRGASRPAGT